MATNRDRGSGIASQEPPAASMVQPANGLGRRYAPDGAPALAVQESTNFTRDRVRWGPIWAGFLTTLTVFLLLSLLGLAVGLTNVHTGSVTAGDTGRTSAIWLAISGIISFLIGGYVTGKTAAVFDRMWGALNGGMIFFLTVPLIVWLASVGAAVSLGSLGNSIRLNLSLVQSASTANTARSAAWGTLIALLVALIASALGGYLGTRRPQVDPVTGAVRE
ncbi:MAG TPA: hypothetical protein VHB98_19650 [Chloroflexota bacterium]|nr:hypothetical protein [Chloroflexota bacterium]